MSINILTNILRDYRSREMRILIAVILSAVICITAIAFSIDAIRKNIHATSATLIGGDLVVSAPDQIAPQIISAAQKNKLEFSQTVNFYSMLSTNDNLLLASIKAVDDKYPLLGAIKISSTIEQKDIVTATQPPIGEIWLESRAILQLGTTIGAKLQVGDAELKLTAVLVTEPDRVADGFTFAPRGMLNIIDVEKTKAVIPGSRVTYKLLLVGNASALQQFNQDLQSYKDISQYTFTTPESTRNAEKNLDLAQKYLNLALLVNIILAAVTVSITAKRYSSLHTIDAAILRSFGASSKQILFIYSSNLLFVAVIVGLIGSALGFLTEQIIAKVLAQTVSLNLSNPGFWPLLLGLGCSIALIALFAIPPIFKLAKTAPMRVLHNAATPTGRSGWRLKLNLSNNLPPLLRLSLNNIAYNTQHNLLQIFAFAIIICVGTVLIIVRNDLLQNWQTQLPAKIPNYFAINIPSDELSSLQKYLHANNIQTSEIYPIVRGNLIKINGQEVSVDPLPGKRQGINRALNLTWSGNLPYENRLIEGNWFTKEDFGKPLISIEREIAQTLNVAIGDELTFLIQDEEVTASILNIRTVVWGSFTPNFYVLYNPGVIDNSIATYMTSFYMPQTHEVILLDFVKQFPQINLINIAAMIDQAQMVLSLLSLVIAFIWIFTLSIGCLLLLAIVLASINLRIYQNNLMRIFGAAKLQLLGALIIEYVIIGAIAGAIGSLSAIIIAQQVSMRYLTLAYSFNWLLIIYGVFTGITIMLIGGYFGTRKVFANSPIQINRNLS